MADEKKVAACEMDDAGAGADLADKSAAPAITCPHCGAPVKYSADGGGSDMDDADGGDADGAMDEGGGDADALEELDDAAGGDALEELAEPSTDTEGDPGIQRTTKKAGAVDAEELDDAVAADDDDAALDDDVAAGGQPAPPAPAAKAMGKVKKMAGIKPAPPAVKPAAKPAGAAPPPAAPKMDEASLRELRSLREATAKLERQLAVQAQLDKQRAGRALLQRGLKEGKLTKKMIGSPEKPTYTRRFALTDPRGFSQWLAKEAPIVVEFKERGTAKETENVSTFALSESIDKMARDKMRADTSLDYSAATRRVLSENPRFQNDYDREMSGQGPREVQAVSGKSNVK